MSSREQVLEAALELMRAGQSVSLDSAARAVGITKPGLMHHFPTKAVLMLALVDEVVERWVDEIDHRLTADEGKADPRARVLAYLDWCLDSEPDPSDLVMLADPRLREPLTKRWAERFGPWFALPVDVPATVRSRLAAVRLLADGVWFAGAIDFLPPHPDERDTIRAIAHHILEN